MRIFEITDLSLDFVGKSIFNKTSLMVQDSDHIGLVGPNGCGKSTFLRIVLGEIIPDSWTYEARGKLKIGYLDQFADILEGDTVHSYLNSVFCELYSIDARIMEIYDSLTALDEDAQMKAITQAQRLQEQLDDAEFEQVPKKINNVLYGLGFTDDDRDKDVRILSGGMKTKLILAKILLTDNDILILDEPTNFLDIKYTAWLGEYLSRLKYAYIVISHDITFLNKISNRIIEIANRKFKIYDGNYDFYVKEKARREDIQIQQQKAQAKYIAQAEKYVASNSEEATGGIVRSKATWLKKMLQSLERIEKPDQIVKPEFNFLHLKGATTLILKLDSAEVGYAESPILPPMSLEIMKGEKVVFRGFNGIGKTTLLKSISGDLLLVGGDVEFGEGIESVFLKQEEDYENNFSSFNRREKKRLGVKGGKEREITVMEFAKEYYPEKTQGELQKSMFACGLNEVHIFGRVKSLSGGEMTKLRLCLAMMNRVNLIILDEPTNHLDPFSKEVLMHALEEFEGTIIMTTHDINADISWADKVINLESLFD